MFVNDHEYMQTNPCYCQHTKLYVPFDMILKKASLALSVATGRAVTE